MALKPASILMLEAFRRFLQSFQKGNVGLLGMQVSKELTKNGRPNEFPQISDEPHVKQCTEKTYTYACGYIYGSPENPVLTVIARLKLEIPYSHPNTRSIESEQQYNPQPRQDPDEDGNDKWKRHFRYGLRQWDQYQHKPDNLH